MNFKKFLSFFLVLSVFLGCSVTSFAEQDNSAKYAYRGELTEGWNLVWDCDSADEFVEDLYVSYSFSIPSDGYYCLNYGTPHTDMSAEIIGAHNYEEALYDYYGIERLYFLEKGDYSLTVDVYYSDVEVYIYTEYLGETITDISFDHDQLFDSDFWCYEDFYSDEIVFVSTANSTFTFDSGKTYEFCGTLSGAMDSECIDGVNNITIIFLDQSIPSTATVYDISYYIKDIEVSNIEEYFDKSIEYFNHFEPAYPYGETITVTFTDLSTQRIEFDGTYASVELSNGQYYEIEIIDYYSTYYDSINGGNCCFEIYVGDVVVKEYYFYGTKVSLVENLKLFMSEMKSCLEDFSYYFVQMFKNLNTEEASYYFDGVIASILYTIMIPYDFFAYII